MANGAFDPGTGELKSTNLIAAFLELAMIVQTQERIALTNQAILATNNLPVPDNVIITANFNTDTMTVSIPALPVNFDLVSGNIQVSAIDYLAPINAVVPAVVNSFDNTDSDLVSTNKVKALLELAQLIQEDEALATGNPNNLTVGFNSDIGIASINGTFPGVPQPNANGRIEFVATNYLA